MTLSRTFSPSQLRLWLACPEAYRRRYVEPDQAAPRIPQVFVRGRGLDTAARIQLQRRAKCQADLGYEDFVRAARAAHDLALVEEDPEPDLSAEESGERVALAAGNWWGRFVDSQQGLRPRHLSDIQKRAQRMAPKGIYSILGYVDVVLSDGMVCDVKYADREPRDDTTERNREQLVTYAWLVGASEAAIAAAWPEGARWETMSVTPADVEQVLDLYRQLFEATRAGQFTPNPTSWMCSERFCAHWSDCEAVRAGVLL